MDFSANQFKLNPYRVIDLFEEICKLNRDLVLDFPVITPSPSRKIQDHPQGAGSENVITCGG